MLVYLLARHNGRTEVVTLVLTGIALNTMAGAGTGLLTYVATDEQFRAVVFWSLGSLGGATWEGVGATVPFVAGRLGRWSFAAGAGRSTSSSSASGKRATSASTPSASGWS